LQNATHYWYDRKMTASPVSAAKTYDLECSVARTLEQVGDRWTHLIIRDALYGVRRFDDFQADLGIARNILTKRLNRLVNHGILRKEQYQAHPPRYEYRLTEKGRDLVPILMSLLAWGDRWLADGDVPLHVTHTDCGHQMHAVSVCSECAGSIDAFNLEPAPVPPVIDAIRRERATSP